MSLTVTWTKQKRWVCGGRNVESILKTSCFSSAFGWFELWTSGNFISSVYMFMLLFKVKGMVDPVVPKPV